MKTNAIALIAILLITSKASGKDEELEPLIYNIPIVPIAENGLIEQLEGDCQISHKNPFSLRAAKIGDVIGHQTRLFLQPDCVISVRFSDGKELSIRGDHETIDVVFGLYKK